MTDPVPARPDSGPVRFAECSCGRIRVKVDGAPLRVSALNVPIPYNHALEKAALPDSSDVVAAVRGIFGV